MTHKQDNTSSKNSSHLCLKSTLLFLGPDFIQALSGAEISWEVLAYYLTIASNSSHFFDYKVADVRLVPIYGMRCANYGTFGD